MFPPIDTPSGGHADTNRGPWGAEGPTRGRPGYEIAISEIDPASFSWQVRSGGSTVGGGVAEDAELARLRAERFIEDRREG